VAALLAGSIPVFGTGEEGITALPTAGAMAAIGFRKT